ncbi:MAG: aspartate kinase [Spirochaetales bacterium]|nr:MAG: aspartate kinase [Spirochaetales bacterium]
MVVLKIGGTSMGSAARMDQALDIARSLLPKAPVMVCSAMGGITDRIIEASVLAQQGLADKAMQSLEAIKDVHYQCAQEFLEGDILADTRSDLDHLFTQFASLLKGVSLLRDCSPRSLDALLSFGERLSTRLIHSRAVQQGMASELLDARGFIRTNDSFNKARPDMEETFRLTAEQVQPAAGKLIITQGFIGSTSSEVTTTLGRGGSDYSASIIGAALNAEEIQIWTDVNGIMTCDPRLIPQAFTVPEITYMEAGELAFFGAKVVHPATIQPAVVKGIPVRVKNTARPEEHGTRIAADAGFPGLKALSVKKNITVLNITSSRMLEAHGFLSLLFAVFDAAETPVDLVSTSEVSVSMTIERTDRLEEIIDRLKELGEVSAEKGMAIICMVGEHLWKDPAFPAKAFGALEDIPIRMISLGASEVNLSLVVPENQAEKALNNLHSHFFG